MVIGRVGKVWAAAGAKLRPNPARRVLAARRAWRRVVVITIRSPMV
jgi:hypothetical protein